MNLKFKSHFCHVFCVVLLALGAAACSRTAAPAEKAAPATVSLSPKSDDLPAVVAFGDSLTAGFGLTEEQSYPRLLQQKLDAGGYRYRVVNAGVSGDTSAGGARRIDWALEGNVKVVILELGGNDGLRGLSIADMKKNLSTIIERAQARGAAVILAGMEAPPNLGAEYTAQFRQTFRDLAKQYKLPFIPFVLDGVGGRPDLNQADGIHPNAAGEQIMTETVWKTLEPLLQK